MERKYFLKSLLVGSMAAPAVLAACGKEDGNITPSTTTPIDTTGTGYPTTCTVAPTETEGPFPTHQPATYLRSDITDGRTGYKLTSKITIVNANDSCNYLADAIVDIWHCDAEGNYSEYGGTQMQSTNYQAVHFLRGRQVTGSTGMVTFTSIFPGWYQGRATHIHVHIYNQSGTSLKVTQIAFPEGTGSAVTAVNGYGKGLSGYTSNAQDNIFSDDNAGIQLAAVTGNTTNGFNLSITFAVQA